MLKHGVIIGTELTHSSTILKRNSAAKLGIATIACYDTPLSSATRYLAIPQINQRPQMYHHRTMWLDN